MAATKVKDLVKNLDYMNFVNYENYKDNNKEFLRTDLWQLTFTSVPKVVYYPGDVIMNSRLTAVNVAIDSSITSFDKRFRGNFTVKQSTGQSTFGNLTLNFVDREDQAISYFVDDWKQKIADRDTKYSFRKDDLVANCKLVLLNSSRIPVRTIEFFNCIITDGALDESGAAEDGGDRADIQVNLFFEHYTREFNNL